jgi:molybdopterin-guanine dinucleotide biosynthesis protein A
MIETLGVLLAGGEGRRLGLGVPKAFARLRSQTFLDRARRVLARVCDDVIVCRPAGMRMPDPGEGGDLVERDRVARMLAQEGIGPPRFVDDAPGLAGPIAGLVAGLTALPYRRAVVLAVDFPLMGSSVLEYLIAKLGDLDAVVPTPGGRVQPLVAAYAAGAGARFAAAAGAGENSPSCVALATRHVRVEEEELERLPWGLHNFFNVNTAEDLETITVLHASQFRCFELRLADPASVRK